MRTGELLRRLDQRLLPPLARALTGRSDARPRALAWVAFASVGAVLFTAVWTTGRPPAGDRTVGEVTRVGVGDGDSIPGYLRAADDELAALPDPAPSGAATWALVSLAEYLPPARLAPVLGDIGVSAVFGRVPLPGRQTEIVRIPALRVPDDVVAGMTELAVRKDREAADYRARGAELAGGDPQARELREWYDSSARVAAAEAAAYRAGCSCVYAAVVRAEPAKLRSVAGRPGVRAVDPAPEVRRLDRTVFTPPLPEQRDEARPPADTELPTVPSSPRTSPAPSATGSTGAPATGSTDAPATGPPSVPAPTTAGPAPTTSVAPGGVPSPVPTTAPSTAAIDGSDSAPTP
ncbi:hypothetical protein O7606_01115 [Micromonospora sp. WMMD882]|uniref:hypothetical protein n=1 Tax=Micromonospora sp. WMMD882 TaxID=3015151 RepID=UPI00248C348C|nr:hypothetical protein [Micromonospora sp. WMMD882]WBB80033.1 hypothetical protein O7606_01115 [Micromonospora sp. WMMD882]